MPIHFPLHSARALTLVLIVLLAAGCSRQSGSNVQAAAQSAPPLAQPAPLPMPEPARYLRDLYTRQADCVGDWGRPDACTAAPPGSAAGATVIGPTYSSAIRHETQRVLRQEAVDQGYAQSVEERATDLSVGRIEVKPG
jgi:hypothetical protein